MIILANGDSHTAATNPNYISPTGIRPDRSSSSMGDGFYNYDISWAKFVADYFNAEYINIAEPGSGSEQIYRSTVIAVNKLIKKYDKTDICVLILWSISRRYETWYNSENRFLSLSPKNTWNIEKPFINYINSRSIAEPIEYVLYKDLFYMYSLSLILNNCGVNYLFMNSNKTVVEPDNFKNSPAFYAEYKELYELYGDRKHTHIGFSNKEETFEEYLKETEKIPYSASPYWDIEGHKKYAKFIQKNLTLINK